MQSPHSWELKKKWWNLHTQFFKVHFKSLAKPMHCCFYCMSYRTHYDIWITRAHVRLYHVRYTPYHKTWNEPKNGIGFFQFLLHSLARWSSRTILFTTSYYHLMHSSMIVVNSFTATIQITTTTMENSNSILTWTHVIMQLLVEILFIVNRKMETSLWVKTTSMHILCMWVGEWPSVGVTRGELEGLLPYAW